VTECNGICITAGDIGFPEYGDAIAYPHPDCDLHGAYPHPDCELHGEEDATDE
jgi:hypothetical protein